MITVLEASLLGLLVRGPQTGYELTKTMERGQFFRSGSPGAIYPALHRLEAAKHIWSQVQGRSHVYSITPAGRSALAQFCQTPVTWKELFTEPTLLRMKLRGSPLLPSEERIAFLQNQRREIQRAILESELRRDEVSPEHISWHIVTLAIEHLRLDQQFIDDMLDGRITLTLPGKQKSTS